MLVDEQAGLTGGSAVGQGNCRRKGGSAGRRFDWSSDIRVSMRAIRFIIPRAGVRKEAGEKRVEDRLAR